MFPAASRIDASALELNAAAAHQILSATLTSTPTPTLELDIVAAACLLEPLHGQASCSSSSEILQQELETLKRHDELNAVTVIVL
jgi:hypothetical protein